MTGKKSKAKEVANVLRRWASERNDTPSAAFGATLVSHSNLLWLADKLDPPKGKL